MIDNYDSFTWNLVQLIGELTDETIEVVRNDEGALDQVIDEAFSRVVISPGPGRPENAGKSVEVIRRLERTPLLGVCLGHQAIAVAFGGEVRLAGEPRHGKPSVVTHSGDRLFSGCASELEVIRYHSLVVDREQLPAELEITAESDDGNVMALSHTSLPIHGVQFHPESFGSEGGRQLLENFLREEK